MIISESERETVIGGGREGEDWQRGKYQKKRGERKMACNNHCFLLLGVCLFDYLIFALC
jgi:hypothetical protein